MEQPSRYLKSVLLSETGYFINVSRAKYVCVGLSPALNFEPAIVVGGSSVPDIVLSKCDWETLLENEGVLLDYFFSANRGEEGSAIAVGNVKAYFGACGKHKVVRFEDRQGQFVSLGLESLEGLFQKQHAIAQKLCELEQKEFNDYYATIIRCIRDLSGNHKENIAQVLHQLQDAENAHTMMELVEKVYSKVLNDIRI